MPAVLKRILGGLIFLIGLALGLAIVGGCVWFVSGGVVKVLAIFGLDASREAAAWLLFFVSAIVAGLRGFK